MRWQGREESDNVEDIRGRRRVGKPMAIGGGLGMIVLLLVVALLGGDPQKLLQNLPQDGGAGAGGGFPGGMNLPQEDLPGDAVEDPVDPREEEQRKFVGVILNDTEEVWGEIFARGGERYAEPKLVIYRDSVESACGRAGSTMGPFYCPADQKVYIDLSFFDEMRDKFQAAGDFAQAYVIAHEVGHHIQNLLGVSDQVHQARRRVSEEEYNRLSVRLELQADFYAGVWAHHAQKKFRYLEEGDIEEALRCAAAIGDDRLQKQSQGYVIPESFTHGTSQQRARWFRRGIESGDMNKGNTFEVPDDEL